MEASAFHTKLKSYEMSLAAGKENEMDDAELEFAHRYFSWKRVRGGGIKVIPNEEAILAAQKDFGIFVILSNLHASPWDALRRYRRRNDIETSYRVVKSDLDGRKPRVWTMTSVRGKEICRHVALGYRFVLQSMMERTAQEAERRANDESLGKTVRKQYETDRLDSIDDAQAVARLVRLRGKSRGEEQGGSVPLVYGDDGQRPDVPRALLRRI